MSRDAEVKADESFPITARDHTRGKLLDGTDCEILIDTGTVSFICQNLTFYNVKLTCNATVHL